VMKFPVMQLPVAHAHTITSNTPTNNNWAVPIYYSGMYVEAALSYGTTRKQPTFPAYMRLTRLPSTSNILIY
jgi:hypothetical protein